MSFTQTPNLHLYKPTVNADNDQWGTHLNSNADTLDAAVPAPSSTTPNMDGTGAPGSATVYARGDHTHPTDSTRAPLASPVFTGTPSLPTGTTAVTQTAGNNTTAPATTAFVQAAVAPALNDAGRNLAHNGDFTIQQRGTGPFTTTSFTYTADRWGLSLLNSTTTTNVVALADTDRTAIGDESARFALSSLVNGTAGAGDNSTVFHCIEGLRRLSGKTVTVSLWARSNSGNPRLGVNFYQVFGQGGTPSATVTVPGQTVTLSTTWTRYSLTFNMPSTAAKTFGTNPNTDSNQLYFWFSAGTTYATDSGGVGVQSNTFILWGVQVEVGSVMTPLEKRDPQQELALCQRFYATLWTSATGYASAAATWYASNPGYFAVAMRAMPTVTLLQNKTSGNTNAPTAGNNYGGNDPGSIWVSAQAPAAGMANYNWQFAASADL